MFEHLVDSEDPQNLEKPDDLPRLPHYFHILQTLQEERYVERYEADEVHDVHGLDEEPDLGWRN